MRFVRFGRTNRVVLSSDLGACSSVAEIRIAISASMLTRARAHAVRRV